MITLAAHRIWNIPMTDDRISMLPDPVPAPTDTLTHGLTEALNWLEHGVILVDETARVLFVSSAASEVLESRRLRLSNGVLRSQSTAETVALHRLIARCALQDGSTAEGSPAPCRIGDPALSLLLAPLRNANGQDEASELSRVIIFIADPGKMAPPTAQQLRNQFGLTAAEATFAIEIIKGEGLKACADRLGISQPTARTHLHRIFDKTGTRRQAELVHAVFASRVPVRRHGGDA